MLREMEIAQDNEDLGMNLGCERLKNEVEEDIGTPQISGTMKFDVEVKTVLKFHQNQYPTYRTYKMLPTPEITFHYYFKEYKIYRQ